VDVYDVGCMWDLCTGCTCYVDVCGTYALIVVHAMWDYRIGCACYVDVCGTSVLVVHAMWAHVLLLHWLYMLCGLCGTTALVLHAVLMYVVWLLINRTDVRIFFIQKITQWKCHPQCTPHPDPYTAPCESSTVGSNSAGRVVIAYS
jgi:hypothetical protein